MQHQFSKSVLDKRRRRRSWIFIWKWKTCETWVTGSLCSIMFLGKMRKKLPQWIFLFFFMLSGYSYPQLSLFRPLSPLFLIPYGSTKISAEIVKKEESILSKNFLYGKKGNTLYLPFASCELEWALKLSLSEVSGFTAKNFKKQSFPVGPWLAFYFRIKHFVSFLYKRMVLAKETLSFSLERNKLIHDLFGNNCQGSGQFYNKGLVGE